MSLRQKEKFLHSRYWNLFMEQLISTFKAGQNKVYFWHYVNCPQKIKPIQQKVGLWKSLLKVR